MNKILVTYATMAGSTAEVAEKVAAAIKAGGLPVEVLPISEVNGLDGYGAVVVGGPMIMGWHRQAAGFLKRNRAALQQLPLAVFVTAMSLTRTEDMDLDSVQVVVDEKLPKAPADPNRLSFRERYARLSNYLRPILGAVQPAKPASIGVFGGRLEYGRLPWWGVLFAMLIIQAPAGDKRNWPAIEAWAAGLPSDFNLDGPAVE
jgi:menaquinone-dependent protoporphyrinogen oxidase